MVQRDYDAVVRRVEAVSGVDVQILGEVDGLPVLRVSAGKGDAPVVYINGGRTAMNRLAWRPRSLF